MDKLYVDELPEIRKFAVDLSLLGSNETAVPEAGRRLEATLEVPLRFGRGLLTADSDTTPTLNEVKSNITGRRRLGELDCPAGYYDATEGTYESNWECGSGCAGGLYTDVNCSCACQCSTGFPPNLRGSNGPCVEAPTAAPTAAPTMTHVIYIDIYADS